MWFGIAGAFIAVSSSLVWLMFQAGSSGRLKRNRWVGIRVPSTLKSDAAWIDGHHAAMMASTGFMIGAVLAGVAALVQLGDPASAGFAFGLAVIVFALGLIRATWAAVRAARTAQ